MNYGYLAISKQMFIHMGLFKGISGFRAPTNVPDIKA